MEKLSSAFSKESGKKERERERGGEPMRHRQAKKDRVRQRGRGSKALACFF